MNSASQLTPGEVLNGESVEALAQQMFKERWPGKAWTGSDVSRSYWRRKARESRPQPSGGQDGGGELARQIDILRRAVEVPLPDDDADFSPDKARRGGESWRAMARNTVAAFDQALASPAKATGWPSREVEEALRGALEWDKARGYRMPYRVRDPIYAALDKLAPTTPIKAETHE